MTTFTIEPGYYGLCMSCDKDVYRDDCESVRMGVASGFFHPGKCADEARERNAEYERLYPFRGQELEDTIRRIKEEAGL